MITARNAQSHVTEAQIDRVIAAAGHRMAGMEPTDYDIEIGRRNYAEKSPTTKQWHSSSP